MVFWHDAGNGDERSSSPSLHSLLSMCCWPFSICFLLIYRRRLCAALDPLLQLILAHSVCALHTHNVVVVVVVRCLLSISLGIGKIVCQTVEHTNIIPISPKAAAVAVEFLARSLTPDGPWLLVASFLPRLEINIPH